MNKKAQGLSINVIIIVAIALIVLVVLIALFTGRLGGFVSGVNKVTDISCSAQGGNLQDPPCGTGFSRIASSDADTQRKVCCKRDDGATTTSETITGTSAAITTSETSGADDYPSNCNDVCTAEGYSTAEELVTEGLTPPSDANAYGQKDNGDTLYCKCS